MKFLRAALSVQYIHVCLIHTYVYTCSLTLYWRKKNFPLPIEKKKRLPPRESSGMKTCKRTCNCGHVRIYIDVHYIYKKWGEEKLFLLMQNRKEYCQAYLALINRIQNSIYLYIYFSVFYLAYMVLWKITHKKYPHKKK